MGLVQSATKSGASSTIWPISGSLSGGPMMQSAFMNRSSIRTVSDELGGQLTVALDASGTARVMARTMPWVSSSVTVLALLVRRVVGSYRRGRV